MSAINPRLLADPSMQLAIQPPADVVAWLNTLPAADAALLAEWYVEWYRTLPISARLPYFRALASIDNKPRTVAYYDKELLITLVPAFEQSKAPWLLKFALDYISNAKEFRALYATYAEAHTSIFDLDSYHLIVNSNESADENFKRLQKCELIPGQTPAWYRKSQGLTLRAYNTAALYDGKPPRKKRVIIKHPAVAAWLRRIPAEEVELVHALCARSLSWNRDDRYMQLLVDLARRDTDPAKRIPLCALSPRRARASSSDSVKAAETTLLCDMTLSSGVGAVYVQFVLDYILTSDDSDRIHHDGLSLDFSYLDMIDYEIVRAAAVAAGHSAAEVLDALRQRNAKSELKARELPFKVPGAAYRKNKKYIVEQERHELSVRYRLS